MPRFNLTQVNFTELLSTSKLCSVSIVCSAIAFVAGAWTLQQFAFLPSLLLLSIATILAFFLVFLCLDRQKESVSSSFAINQSLHFFLFYIAIFLLGVSWSAVRATYRMQDVLPHAWEQKTILLEGVVSSVPEITERGERFKFDVEKIFTQGAVVPKHISLNHYYKEAEIRSSINSTSEVNNTQFNQQFHTGERWKISVRLKRPHGTINPNGFDFEAWALSENIRATGSIKAKAGL